MKEGYITRYIKKNGKKRKILTYADEVLREEHKEIKKFLEGNLTFSKFTKAYIPNSSIYKNAKAHMYNDIFIKYDIKDFFNNIDHKLLVKQLHEQLNLKYDKEKYSLLEVSQLINKCSYGKKGLPLGLISSPILANIYLKDFDNIVYGKLKNLGLTNIIYTRYADDLVISFKNIENVAIKFYEEKLKEIEAIVIKFLKKFKLKLNTNKKSIIDLNKSNHVRITGISITKDKGNYRSLSVGKKKVISLYDEALKLYLNRANELNDEQLYKIARIKGMESFIFSIHKKGYDHMFSQAMVNKLNDLGFKSLHELIQTL